MAGTFLGLVHHLYLYLNSYLKLYFYFGFIFVIVIGFVFEILFAFVNNYYWPRLDCLGLVHHPRQRTVTARKVLEFQSLVLPAAALIAQMLRLRIGLIAFLRCDSIS